jgi:hypothetical protein
VSLCTAGCLLLFHLQQLKWEVFNATATQTSLAHVMVTQMLCCLCSEQQSVGGSATAVGMLAVSGL